MKKITIVTIAFAALSLASCKKTYTCECTIEQKLVGSVSTTKMTYTTKDRKDGAKEYCDSFDMYSDFGGGDYSKTTCDLK